MTVVTETLATAEVRSPWREAWRRYRKDRFAKLFLVMFGVFFLLAVTAQIIEFVEIGQGNDPTYDRSLAQMGYEVSPGKMFEETHHAPTLKAFPLGILGLNWNGKSVLLHVFHGTKVAFVVGFWGSMLSVLIGMTLGLMAGFLGKFADETVVYLYSTLASIPYLLLMLALAFIFREGKVAEWYRDLWIAKYVSLGLFNIIMVIGLTYWVTLCRLVRAEVLKVRELDYVNAARSLGFGNFRIMFKHVLPNVFHLVIINFSLTFVIAIKSEVILTFLGVGVDKEPSWGQMISFAKNELMRGIWWPLAAAGAMLFLLTLSVNYVGDALRDALDPKLKD
ncbi:MAG: peptide ABC transporter permease [Planctomycetes bacterium]|nr:peptide ABC transporter permease [Planctomycetota bacterium]MDP6423360.1 ABC transporter permease [Planctomycetota bacterium]